ncbi:replication-relaxation family protein [Glycomyces sp. NPDC046736]|uniref:replication-relaxation family protein n=1 Tax=Glycomyces sp. NPDC046736 TaxID=3155615 RepID=UPI0033F87046
MTDRDREIVAALDKFKVFTLEQICRLFFTSISSARDRLSTLVEMGVLARSRPGTRSAYRYYLGLLGLRLLHADLVVAYENTGPDRSGMARPINPGRAPTPARAREHAEVVFSSAHRPHREGVNDFYTRLVVSCRSRSSTRLAAWETEAREHRWYTVLLLRPDGIFDLKIDGQDVRPFWFEYDTGSETLERLADKARRWSDFIERHLKMTWTLPLMLIELTKPGRETNLHNRLVELGAVHGIATTTTARSADPLGAVWREVGDSTEVPCSLEEILPPNARHCL